MGVETKLFCVQQKSPTSHSKPQTPGYLGNARWVSRRKENAAMASMDDFLFPNVLRDNWQMMTWDRIALSGVLARMRPKISLEIGVYYGGSLSLTSQFVEKIYAIDIDPETRTRFAIPANAELIIGDSVVEIPRVLKLLEANDTPLEFVLIDADHSSDGVRRDIELVLAYQPVKPMIIMAHDSGNPLCREGIQTAGWDVNPYVQSVDLDFVPGGIIEHSVSGDIGECWGGFAIAYLTPEARHGQLPIFESARTSIRSNHYISRNLNQLPQR